MSCCGSEVPGKPNDFNPESKKPLKPENDAGCCPGKDSNTCDTPSVAAEESPLWKWEQKYGKIVTTVTFVQDRWGHTVQVVEKKACPLVTPSKERHGCCSITYRTFR